MRVYKNKEFHKWSKKQRIEDDKLLKAIEEMNDGLYDANLGGGIYKKRLAYGGKGKRGGVRTIVVFQYKKIAFFIYGYPKSKQGNITDKEEAALKALAAIYVSFTES